MSEFPRTRASFPASEGWIILGNHNSAPVEVILEPWAVGGEMPKGQTAHLLMVKDGTPPPTFMFGNAFIQIYCANAMYRDGEEVIDFTD